MNTQTQEPASQKLIEKLNVNKLKEGDFVSRTSYMQVLAVRKQPFSNETIVEVRNEHGKEWTIAQGIVAAECYSHNQVLKEQPVTRTELIKIFSETGDTIYTVNYCKQPKVEEAYEAVANNGKLKTNAEIKKALKEKMKGEERTLVGYTLKADTMWGRSMVVDLEQENREDRIRQVDHRTLNWLIFKNVRYVVKG